MANRTLHLTVSLRSGLCSVPSSPEHLLGKLASIAAPEDDVGPEVVRCLCDISLLDSLDLDTSEQDLVLKAVSFAVQEKIKHFPTGSGSAGLDMLLACLCITPFQSIFKIGAFGAKMKMWEELHEQFWFCRAVLRQVHKQQADDKCKQQLEAREPLLSRQEDLL